MANFVSGRPPLGRYELSGARVSTDNSSTTPLNTGTSFTGAWEEAGSYDSIVVSVATDQSGYYTIQFSTDGVNADSTLTRYHRVGQIHVPHRFTITRRYTRVIYTNSSGSNQTYFRLQTLFGDKTQLNVPLDGVVSQDYDAWVTRPTDFQNEVSLGLRKGWDSKYKWGYNLDFGVSSEVVAAFGGTFTPLTSASTLTIVSSSTDDDGSPAGNGAQTLLITGIDSTRTTQTEIVTMDGTTNVVTTSTWLGINRVVVLSSGSNNTNAGTITITATTGGSTQAILPVGESVTQQCIYFVQNDHKGLLDWALLNANRNSGSGNPRIIFKIFVYSPITDTRYQIFRYRMDTSAGDNKEINFKQPLLLSAGDVIWFEAESSSANTEGNVRFSLIEVRDVDA